MLKEYIQIVCVDDHPVVLAGLRSMIGHSPGLALIGEATTAAEACAAVSRLRPHLLIIDVRLPDGDGIDTAAGLRAAYPGLGIIALSTFAGDESLYRSRDAGIDGFVLKEYAQSELIAAIRAVAAGRRYAPQRAAELLFARGPRVVLTAREREVLRAMARGLRNREIGRELGMGEGTARSHVESLRSKFGCRDRQSTIATAATRGFLTNLVFPS